MSSILVVCILLLGGNAEGNELKIASWNIEWLHQSNNSGVVPRKPADYKAIKKYVRILNADVIALQEVDGFEAAKRIFPPRQYNFYFSSRNFPQRVGFAVKKNIDVLSYEDFIYLNSGNKSLRHGGILKIKIHHQIVSLLNVHLKSGCFHQDLILSENKSCQTLNKQLLILKIWINGKIERNENFIILGDFNRTMSKQDVFWRILNLGLEPKSKLINHSTIKNSNCSDGLYTQFIDHIISSRTLSHNIDIHSFKELLYAKKDKQNFKLSDHCPISIEFIKK